MCTCDGDIKDLSSKRILEIDKLPLPVTEDVEGGIVGGVIMIHAGGP